MKDIHRLHRKLILVTLIGLVQVSLFSSGQDDSDLLERMSQMDGDGRSILDIETDENYGQLKKDIDKYRKIVDEKIDASEKLGTYYKLMGLKYLDYTMYRRALEAFEEALNIYPENANVLYYAGLTSARLSKTEASQVESSNLLNQAVRYYRASLSVNNRFSSPMYGLAILYVYEVDQPELAVPLMELYNTIQKSSMDGRFLLAVALYASGREGEAVEAYNYIIDRSENSLEVESARSNRNSILRGETVE